MQVIKQDFFLSYCFCPATPITHKVLKIGKLFFDSRAFFQLTG
jgi:hypothetical protein